MHSIHADRIRLLSRLSCTVLIVVCTAVALAESPLPGAERLKTSPVLQHLQPNPASKVQGSAAADTVKQMHVPPGFRVEPVAAEPEIRQPVAFAFDARGRIWIAEAHSYPQRQPEGQGLDNIVILEDQDGDGRFESRKIFTTGLNLVSGLEVGHGGVWVGAAPQLLFIPDDNGDDRPDSKPVVLLEGFGYQDTHECLNSFMWGPDGWLYGNQGVFNHSRIGRPGSDDASKRELRAGVWRYHPGRHEFEVFADGGSNQWGLDYDEHGQIFMTHCRSYWGKGGTTHVIQGGHFWNQANANYPPFIIANPPEDLRDLRNFLLASARYDHGAGGAGVQGSDAIYGGHSHIGTLIYQGDNWPGEYRGRLFTHNLHGHQINQQINRRLGSGFDTIHAGKDHLFCTDPRYVAIDLQCGPDGAVYIIDWYDQQHCHNPNTEKWDRGNGRIYRMQHEAAYAPRKVNIAAMSDGELIALQNHANDWHCRMARKVMHERHLKGRLESGTRPKLVELFGSARGGVHRLKMLWMLHLTGGINEEVLGRALLDEDEYIRAWAIQLVAESKQVGSGFADKLIDLARGDSSPVVRLYLASAAQRLGEDKALGILKELAGRAEDSEDRNLPGLIWQGLAAKMAGRIDEVTAIIERCRFPQLRDYFAYYASGLGGGGLDIVIGGLDRLEEPALKRRLSVMLHAMEVNGGSAKPGGWSAISGKLYAHPNREIVQRAERLASFFGDDSLFPRMRLVLKDRAQAADLRKHAFEVLGRAVRPEDSPVFIELLDDPNFRSKVIPLLGKFEDSEAADRLLSRLEQFNPSDRSASIQALCSRASHARRLMASISSGKTRRDHVNAYHVRQLSMLGDTEVNRELSRHWGRIRTTGADKQELVRKLDRMFSEAPLWAYDGREGRLHFEKLCMSCHVLKGEGTRIGPDLTGAGANGVKYFLENIIDPNAVIGSDFQLSNIETRRGDLVSGIQVGETAQSVLLRTTSEQVSILKSDILRRSTGEISLMPEGLLDGLSAREQIELLKFLTSN